MKEFIAGFREVFKLPRVSRRELGQLSAAGLIGLLVMASVISVVALIQGCAS